MDTLRPQRHPARYLWLVLLVSVTGCMTRPPAPVVDRGTKPAVRPAAKVKPSEPIAPAPASRPEFHTVRTGDTLFSIALDHGLDYRELAAWNNIENPSLIRVGQQLRLRPPTGAAVTPLKPTPSTVETRALGTAPPSSSEDIRTQPAGVRVPYTDQAYTQLARTDSAPIPPKPETRPEPVREAGDIDWSWPTAGRVVQSFNGTTAKGIAIAGKAGQSVQASAGGRVIYSGTGIRGLGRLLVIKHNETYFSVYGHNSQLLVKEGQSVTKGQKIAEMGDSDADQVKLHFEIRRFGQPVDPAKLLPERPG